MHQQARDFVLAVRRKHPAFFQDTNVLEVGSLDINGSIRNYFKGGNYFGLDLGPGPGVDKVVPPDGPWTILSDWDVVCSSEMFEHNRHWRATWDRMIDYCRPGGLVFFTCATTGRGEHGTTRTSPQDAPFTNDFYENRVASDFDVSAFSEHHFETEAGHRDLYFWGIKCDNVF